MDLNLAAQVGAILHHNCTCLPEGVVPLLQPEGVVLLEPEGVVLLEPEGVVLLQPEGVVLLQPEGVVLLLQPEGVVLLQPVGGAGSLAVGGAQESYKVAELIWVAFCLTLACVCRGGGQTRSSVDLTEEPTSQITFLGGRKGNEENTGPSYLSCQA